MGTKTRLKFTALVIILGLLLCAKSAYPRLSVKKHNELKISYMNGYLAALKLSPEEIKEILSNKDILKQKVLDSATEYMDVVERMNNPYSRPGNTDKPKGEDEKRKQLW